MDLKELKEIHRKEKMSPYLQELDKGFYKEVKKLLDRVYQKYYEASKSRSFTNITRMLTELENMKNIINDLYETRERKIVSNALYFVKSGDEIELKNLTSEEEELMKGIIKLLKKSRNEVLESFFEEGHHLESSVNEDNKESGNTWKGWGNSEDGGQKKEHEAKAKDDGKPINYVSVKILEDLPSIVGIDGRIYGDFKNEDVVTLPEENAQVFIKRGVAKEIKL